jgi:hypothetical protein
MKKDVKKFLTIFLLIVLIIGVYLFADSYLVKRKCNNECVDVVRSEMSAFVFVTKESETNHILNIYITPSLIFNAKEKIKEFRITDFEGSNGIAQVVLIPPSYLPIDTGNRTFLFTVDDYITQEDIRGEKNSIEYEVSSSVKNFNQVADIGEVSPYFGVVVKNLGSVNYKEVTEKGGNFDGSKYLEYSIFQLKDLTTRVKFTVNIKFENKGTYTQRFIGDLNGELFEQQNTPVIQLDAVE